MYNRPGFIYYARELNKKGILITILSIDESSNSDNYARFSELKGCNYYFILNESDMEKYLIKQLNYICFPALYDMKINFISDNAYLIRTIGCGQENEKSKKTSSSNKDLINTTTIFPSDLKELNGNYYQEGGLILLKIKPKFLFKSCKVVLNLKYEEVEGNKFDRNYEIEFSGDEHKKGDESPCYEKRVINLLLQQIYQKNKKIYECKY